MIFWLAGSIGTMFSGFLQAAAYTNLHGVHGRAGCEFHISLLIDALNSHETTIFKGSELEEGTRGLTDSLGRWLFIIDGIITLPLALAGYIFFPNLPQDGKRTWWTTEKEHILSVKRMGAIGRVGKQPWTKAKVRKILFNWHIYILRKSPPHRYLSSN